MPKDTNKLFQQLQPAIRSDFHNLSQKREDSSQYRVGSIPVHTHNNIDSPPVQYSNLLGVKSMLVRNTITLSSAQVKALHTTPIVLIPNPGHKAFIFVDGVAGRLTYNGTAYTGTNNLEFRYTDGAGLKVCADMPATVFLNSTSSAYSYSPWQVDYNRNTDSNFTPTGGDTGNNGQVVVCTPNANPGAGTGIVTLIIYYRVVSFTT